MPLYRDDALPLPASGEWVFSATPTVGGPGTDLGDDRLRMSPFWVPRTVTLVGMAAEVVTAGSAGCTYRLALYRDDGGTKPEALVLDPGTIDGAVEGVQAITGLSVTLARGCYWTGGATQGSPASRPAIRVYASNATSTLMPTRSADLPAPGAVVNGIYVDGASGALPSTIGAVSGSGYAPRILLMFG